jgi:hypothetical protein
MPRKRGPPTPGVERPLTSQESALLGVSNRWWVRVNPWDGKAVVLRPWKRVRWPVRMDPADAEADHEKLTEYWAQDKRASVVLTQHEADTISAVAHRAILVTRMPNDLRQALVWIINRMG